MPVIQLVDSAAVGYLRDYLVDAITEFDGSLIGVTALDGLTVQGQG